MKTCSKCNVSKPLSEFYAHKDSPDGKAWECKECTKKRTKGYKETREYVREYLKTHPCVDCGEIDPVVLDFDHVKGKKIKSVSRMVYSNSHLSKVKKEISKCQVRCANCHRRKTAKQLGWWSP